MIDTSAIESYVNGDYDEMHVVVMASMLEACATEIDRLRAEERNDRAVIAATLARAERVEAALARVEALCDRWSADVWFPRWNYAAQQVRAALRGDTSDRH